MSQADAPSANDYAAILAMLESAASAPDRAAFGRSVCSALWEALAPCVSVAYTESSDDASRAAAVIWPEPPPGWFGEYQSVYEAHMTQNPVLTFAVEHGGELPAPTAWSDVDPTGAFSRTELYRQFYEPNGIRSQLSITVPVEHGGLAGVSINRDGAEFSDRERAMLAIASPLLGWAHRHVIEHAAPLVRPAGVEFGETWTPADDHAAAMRERLTAAGLTSRQADVVLHLATGATNAQIARALGISGGTVRKHLENAYAALGVTNRVAAAAVALGGRG